jgi:ADP-ribosyl-[dinitrogen reductase] hydrolase
LIRLVERFAAANPDFSPAGKPQTDPPGFIVPTLRAVFQALLRAGGFEDGLIDVVNRGGDADTTGAILGMILGALHGTGALPKRWLKKLDPATRAACETQATQLVAFAPALSGRSRAVTAE